MHAYEEDVNYQLIQLMKEHRQRAEEALSQLGLHVSQELSSSCSGEKRASLNLNWQRVSGWNCRR
jgi:hypothetical protein